MPPQSLPAGNAFVEPASPASLSPQITAAYDPQLLAQAGERLAARLADAVATMQNGSGPVLPRVSPETQVLRAESFLSQPPARAALLERFDDLISTALSQGIALHHPHYVGHQVPPPVPLAGLFDAAGAVTNQGMAIYEMGPWAMAVEQAIVRQLSRLIGWSADQCNGGKTVCHVQGLHLSSSHMPTPTTASHARRAFSVSALGRSFPLGSTIPDGSILSNSTIPSRGCEKTTHP